MLPKFPRLFSVLFLIFWTKSCVVFTAGWRRASAVLEGFLYCHHSLAFSYGCVYGLWAMLSCSLGKVDISFVLRLDSSFGKPPYYQPIYVAGCEGYRAEGDGVQDYV